MLPFSQNCAVDKKLTVWIILRSNCGSVNVLENKLGAASSIPPAGQEATAAAGDTLPSIAFPADTAPSDLHRPSSCNRFLHLLVGLHHLPFRFSFISSPPSILTPHLPFYRVKPCVLQQPSQTGSPRNMVRNSIAYVKDDNATRPRFNNASSAVKPLRLHGRQRQSI